MRNPFKTNTVKAIVGLGLLLAVVACSDYFQDPVKDKETGEDINLLIVDFNFFTTRMTFKLQDASDGSTITKPATVNFSGQNGNDIVTFTGKKNADYYTSEGQLELTSDPNVSIAATSPFEFAVTVEIEGYRTLQQGFQLQSEGVKTFELKLSKITDEEETDIDGSLDNDSTFQFIVSAALLKSAKVAQKPYEIKHNIGVQDMLKFTDASGNLLFSSESDLWDSYNADRANFMKATISTYSGYPAGIDLLFFDGGVRSVLFQKLETGKLIKLVIGGKTVGNLNGGKITSKCTFTGGVEPDAFGFANFENNSWKLLGKTSEHGQLDFRYTLISASKETLCGTGSSIAFKSTVKSSFSIDADVYDAENKFITSMNFKGKFPQTFTVENVPDKAVKLVFRNNNPGFVAIAPLDIADFCQGNYEVNVAPTADYREYQIVLKALCPDNKQLAIAPTYNAELKLKDSENSWQGVSMEGGIVDILGLPNQEYELRLLWEEEWEYSSYSTQFDAAGNYLGEPHKDSKIKSKTLPDGRIQISVEKIFEQNICDDLGW